MFLFGIPIHRRSPSALCTTLHLLSTSYHHHIHQPPNENDLAIYFPRSKCTTIQSVRRSSITYCNSSPAQHDLHQPLSRSNYAEWQLLRWKSPSQSNSSSLRSLCQRQQSTTATARWCGNASGKPFITRAVLPERPERTSCRHKI